MKNETILKDERYIAVENASYKIGYSIALFGILILTFIRGVFFQQSAWDLLGLAIFSSLASMAYQVRHGTVPKSWLYGPILIAIGGAVVTAVAVLLRRFVF